VQSNSAYHLNLWVRGRVCAVIAKSLAAGTEQPTHFFLQSLFRKQAILAGMTALQIAATRTIEHFAVNAAHMFSRKGLLLHIFEVCD
jgi:argininosuccinate lyase